jgi:hypothetical protein
MLKSGRCMLKIKLHAINHPTPQIAEFSPFASAAPSRQSPRPPFVYIVDCLRRRRSCRLALPKLGPDETLRARELVWARRSVRAPP